MKHIQTISRPQVNRAQMSTSEILSLVAAILGGLAAILTTIAPLIGGNKE